MTASARSFPEWVEPMAATLTQERFTGSGAPIDGDEAAVRALAACPSRHRITVARLLITPLIDDRDPARIARTRAIVQALALKPDAEAFLRSRLWWRRAVALRALGLSSSWKTAAIARRMPGGAGWGHFRR